MLSKPGQRGLSLVELMVAIVIVGVLAMLASSNFGGWVQNQKIRTAAESILNGLQLARSEAVKNNAAASFVLCAAPADTSWEVLVASQAAPAPGSSVACTASTAAAKMVRVQERSGKEGTRNTQVAVTSAVATTSPITDDGTTAILFNSFGRVVGGSPAIIEVTTPTGDHPLWIKIGVGGNARMCDPSPDLSASDPRRC